MDMSTLNLPAILVAALSAFAIGGLWYSPLLFANIWMRESGMSEEQLKTGNVAKIFGLAFVFLLIMAFNLASFLNDPGIDMASGAFYGFLTGFGWIFFVIAVNSLYELRSWKYVLIVGGYWTLAFTVMGLILGAWR